jgi:hypothetical protein
VTAAMSEPMTEPGWDAVVGEDPVVLYDGME